MSFGGFPFSGASFGGAPEEGTAASGSATLTFSASGTATVVTLSGTGTITFTGSGTATVIGAITGIGTLTFTATASPTSLPTVITNPGSDETSTSFTLNGAVNPNGILVTSCYFNYGTTTSYGSTIAATPAPGAASGLMLVSADLAGLTPGTVYHFQLVAVNANGTATGADQTDRTLAPVYTPNRDVHTVRYLLTTLDPGYGGQPIASPVAELPFFGVTFTKTFNQAGPFSATLNVEHEQVAQTNWINATNPGKCFFWVLIDNRVVYGGRILTRTYSMGAQQITISGTDFYGYWAQRLQKGDYGDYIQEYEGATRRSYAWAHGQKDPGSGDTLPAGAPAPMIAHQILRDAASSTSSLPNLTVPFHGEGVGTKSDPDYWVAHYNAPDNFITFSAPGSQQQSVDALLSQLIGMGAGTPDHPFDGIGCDVVIRSLLDSNGNPHATCNVAWPRQGKTAAELGDAMKVLDLSTVIDMEWSEDATAQATAIVEQAGTGGLMSTEKQVDHTAIGTFNYPLLEQAISHTSATPTALSKSVLATLLKGDRDLYAYPQLAPTVTLPVFANTGLALLDMIPLGDDIGLFNPFERHSIFGTPVTIPFPPKGSPAAMGVLRAVRADVTIADEGVSTMVVTLNPPPGAPSPPGYNTG